MLVKLSQTKNVEFVPKWNGNKELPQTDQIRVYFKNLTVKEKDKMSTDYFQMMPEEYFQQLQDEADRKEEAKEKGEKAQAQEKIKVKVTPELMEAQEKRNAVLMQKYVTKIKNLETEEGPIDTIKKLEESYGLDDLYKEIKEAFSSFVSGDFLSHTSSHLGGK